MAQSQRSSFIAMGGFLSLLALSASPILGGRDKPNHHPSPNGGLKPDLPSTSATACQSERVMEPRGMLHAK